MREASDEITATGAKVVVVGTGAAYQAEHLMRVEGYPFECLVDPDAHFYEAVGIGRVGMTEWLKPSVLWRYARGLRAGGRQGAVTGDWRRLSGVAVVAPDRTLRYLHRADGVGDYPPVAEFLAALRR